MSSQTIIHWNVCHSFVQLSEMESFLVGSICKFSIQDANMERSGDN